MRTIVLVTGLALAAGGAFAATTDETAQAEQAWTVGNGAPDSEGTRIIDGWSPAVNYETLKRLSLPTEHNVRAHTDLFTPVSIGEAGTGLALNTRQMMIAGALKGAAQMDQSAPLFTAAAPGDGTSDDLTVERFAGGIAAFGAAGFDPSLDLIEGQTLQASAAPRGGAAGSAGGFAPLPQGAATSESADTSLLSLGGGTGLSGGGMRSGMSAVASESASGSTDGTPAVTLSPTIVPLPAGLPLLALGLLSFGLLRRKG